MARLPTALPKTKSVIGLCVLLLLLPSPEAGPLPKAPPDFETYPTPRLLKLLTSPNKKTGRQALWALIYRNVNHPRLTRAIIRRMVSDPKNIEWELLDELIRRGESAREAYEPAKKLLKHGEKAIRVYAAALIFSISRQEARRQEGLQLPGKEKGGNLAEWHALASSGKKAVPYMNSLLKSANTNKRMMATGTLGLIAEKHQEAIPGLVTALGDRNTQISLMAIDTLHRLGPKTLPYLRPKLKSKNPYHRMAAASVLSSFAPGERIFLRQDPHPLIRYLADKPQEKVTDTRSPIATAMNDSETMNIARNLMKNRDLRTRVLAAYLLSSRKGVGVKELLPQLLSTMTTFKYCLV